MPGSGPSRIPDGKTGTRAEAAKTLPKAYRLDAPATQIAAALRADRNGDVWPGGLVAPSGYAPVAIGPRAQMVPRQWGVPPPPRGEQVVTHLRNLTSPFWIGTLRHTQFRCLVPATHFLDRGQWACVPSSPIIAFAGIWRDSEVPSFAIVTHDESAMPVILHPQDYTAWLRDDWKQAQHLVAPFPLRLLDHSPNRLP